jgi:hypothetical protein
MSDTVTLFSAITISTANKLFMQLCMVMIGAGEWVGIKRRDTDGWMSYVLCYTYNGEHIYIYIYIYISKRIKTRI